MPHSPTDEDRERWNRLEAGKVPLTGRPSQDAEFAGALFNAAATAYASLQAQWRRVFDISTHEFMTLEHLWLDGALSMGELGDRLGLSRAALTSLVDRIEAAGLVKRSSDPMDRRRTIVSLRDAEETKRALMPVAVGFGRSVVQHVQQLQESERAAIVNFLVHVRDVSVEQAERLRELSDEELRAAAAGQPS